jgi:hypothetical protein
MAYAGSFIGDSWKEWNGRFRDDRFRAVLTGPGRVLWSCCSRILRQQADHPKEGQTDSGTIEKDKLGAGWINRRGAIRGGGWINGGGGGGWVNRRIGGGGGWINRW